MADNPWADHAGSSSFDDLDSFGAGYQPQAGFRPGADTLADGDYDCEIVDAALDFIKGDRVLRLGLRTSIGRVVEYLYWLNRQEAVNRLGADLCVLGFDADRWGSANNRPLSVELPKAVAKLKGVRFRATKSSRQGSGLNAARTFHDLYINCRLDGRPMPPLTPPANHAPPAAPARAAHPVATAPEVTDEIPF